MTTTLEMLILKLIDKKDEYQFNTEYDDGVRRGLALAIVNARELLEKEKLDLIEAHEDANRKWLAGNPTPITQGKIYFEETYQTN